jgi:large subunit ribosomal protein L15
MQLHELQPTKSRATKKRIGRGGKRGKTSGRGHKGQKARAGNSTRPEMRELIKKLPKLRGHGVNRAKGVNAERVSAVPVNVAALEAAFKAKDTVSPKTLVAMGLVATRRKQVPAIKILGAGELTKALTVQGCAVSGTARSKIEAAGGTISL